MDERTFSCILSALPKSDDMIWLQVSGGKRY